MAINIRYKVYLNDTKYYDLGRTRTWNPVIRSQMPYPLRHNATGFRRALMAVNIRYKAYLSMRPNMTTFPGLEPGIP